jgi:hypothetical protein
MEVKRTLAETDPRHPVYDRELSWLLRASPARTRRASSYDRSGANSDFIRVEAGETADLLVCDGAGCVTRLYCAMMLPDLADHRNAILRCYWDGAATPSVEVPLGDFFGLAHARVREFSSRLLAVTTGFGSSHGFNAYFPMPFSNGARITLENRGASTLGGVIAAFWYHIEYETYDHALPEDVLRFHASFRCEPRTVPVGDEPNIPLHDATNLTGADNYVALDTVGAGHMVGLVLEIENPNGPVWYGEGDDMVFIDGERWPPSIHGTGTEEIFGGGACPTTEYASLYSGFHLIESPRFDGLVGMYRWYVHDPIHFARSLRWTLEHGHANNFASGYASVAYWYQTPHAILPPLGSVEELAPPLGDNHAEAYAELTKAAAVALHVEAETGSSDRWLALSEAARPFYRGDFDVALEAIRRLAG